jgi:hypothetical protein
MERWGVDGVVRKPVPCADLQRLVMETLAKRRQEEAEA